MRSGQATRGRPIFRRREKRSRLRIARDFLWPKGGWGRAFAYIRHRLHRLPDTPQRISRGIFVGVFCTFTPFYGLHFFLAAFLAKVFGGNMLAALLSTFFGNPLTYVPIAIISLKTGHFLLGSQPHGDIEGNIVDKFFAAGADLKDNFIALFTDDDADWGRLDIFYDEVFFPYMIGGIIPGLIFAIAAYYLTLPIITAYQKRRKGLLKSKLSQLKEKRVKKADAADRAK